MSTLSLDSIAVDCPNAAELTAFYASLLDVENEGDCIHLRDGAVEIWFQEVEHYQAPTWPTQERGQQVHFDFAARDWNAAVARAESLGATRAPAEPGEHEVVVMLDPAGHTFCMCKPWDEIADKLPEADDVPTLTNLTVDCADVHALAKFYHDFAGFEQVDFGSWGAVRSDPLGLVLFQPVENYQAPTWPTQERGQQIHFDFHTADRDTYVAKATELGAEVQYVAGGFTVMKDPAGHPFCICNPAECELGK